MQENKENQIKYNYEQIFEEISNLNLDLLLRSESCPLLKFKNDFRDNAAEASEGSMDREPKEYTIGDYLIKKTLGQGTFGKVKLGIYLPNNEKVAIKILDKKKITEVDDEIRVRREFDMLSKFNHPNVIIVAEIFESYERYYSVMEYCEGGELFNYIVKNRRLSNQESAFFFYQLINGLEYIHSLGIVHRDLKPENLLLTKDHLLKIIDFGLSNFFIDGQKELLETPCGSPCYASPEMVAGDRYNGVKIDIWSSGIILYAMLCGYLPFEDRDNDKLFEKILECNIKYPSFISKSAKDLLEKIIVKDPDKRITIKEIKHHPFFLKGKEIFEQEFIFYFPDQVLEKSSEIEKPDVGGKNKSKKKEMKKKKIQIKESFEKIHTHIKTDLNNDNQNGYLKTQNKIDNLKNFTKHKNLAYEIIQKSLKRESLNKDLNKTNKNNTKKKMNKKKHFVKSKKLPFKIGNLGLIVKNGTIHNEQNRAKESKSNDKYTYQNKYFNYMTRLKKVHKGPPKIHISNLKRKANAPKNMMKNINYKHSNTIENESMNQKLKLELNIRNKSIKDRLKIHSEAKKNANNKFNLQISNKFKRHILDKISKRDNIKKKFQILTVSKISREKQVPVKKKKINIHIDNFNNTNNSNIHIIDDKNLYDTFNTEIRENKFHQAKNTEEKDVDKTITVKKGIKFYFNNQEKYKEIYGNNIMKHLTNANINNKNISNFERMNINNNNKDKNGKSNLIYEYNKVTEPKEIIKKMNYYKKNTYLHVKNTKSNNLTKMSNISSKMKNYSKIINTSHAKNPFAVDNKNVSNLSSNATINETIYVNNLRKKTKNNLVLSNHPNKKKSFVMIRNTVINLNMFDSSMFLNSLGKKKEYRKPTILNNNRLNGLCHKYSNINYSADINIDNDNIKVPSEKTHIKINTENLPHTNKTKYKHSSNLNNISKNSKPKKVKKDSIMINSLRMNLSKNFKKSIHLK